MRRRVPLAVSIVAACSLFGGCYHYNAMATNTSSQDMGVSLHKGKKRVELSSVVLHPGSSITWEGSTNGPVLVRFAALGETVDVRVPRRRLTTLSASTANGSLEVAKTVAGVAACCTDDDCTCDGVGDDCAACCESDQAGQAEEPQAEEHGETIELVEPEGN